MHRTEPQNPPKVICGGRGNISWPGPPQPKKARLGHTVHKKRPAGPLFFLTNFWGRGWKQELLGNREKRQKFEGVAKRFRLKLTKF